jgi:membrane protein YdbS with pleckstrin-like domain
MKVEKKTFNSLFYRTDLESLLKNPKEKVVMIIRAHPITNFTWVLWVMLLTLVPLIFADFIPKLPLSSTQQLFIIMAWYILVFSFSLTKLFFWYFNLGIVTNRRAIDIDAVNLLYSHTTTAILKNVEEIDKKSLGFFASLFNYADIYVETAGALPNIEFLKAPHPDNVVNIINNLVRYNKNGSV